MSSEADVERLADFAQELQDARPESYIRLQHMLQRSRVFGAMASTLAAQGEPRDYDDALRHGVWQYEEWQVRAEARFDIDAQTVHSIWVARDKRRWGLGPLTRDFALFSLSGTHTIAITAIERQGRNAKSYFTESVAPDIPERMDKHMQELLDRDPATALRPEFQALAQYADHDPRHVIAATSAIVARTLGTWAAALDAQS